MQRAYNQQPFSLDVRLDLEVSFDDKVMETAIYLKRDANDQLLLSEGVCRQLGIISCHPSAEPWRGGKKVLLLEKEVKVPRVVISLCLLFCTSAIVSVQVENYFTDASRHSAFSGEPMDVGAYWSCDRKWHSAAGLHMWW